MFLNGFFVRSSVLLVDWLLAPVVWLVVAWGARRQRVIAEQGEPLTERESALARRAGVHSVNQVRVLTVDVIPMPLPRVVTRLATRAGLLSPHIAGMTLGHGITLRADCRHDARLLAHELTHVAQVERLGGLHPFMRAYVRECAWPGYPRGPLEQEARAAEHLAMADVLPYTPPKNVPSGIAGLSSVQ